VERRRVPFDGGSQLLLRLGQIGARGRKAEEVTSSDLVERMQIDAFFDLNANKCWRCLNEVANLARPTSDSPSGPVTGSSGHGRQVFQVLYYFKMLISSLKNLIFFCINTISIEVHEFPYSPPL
jgi:hypothetical protein